MNRMLSPLLLVYYHRYFVNRSGRVPGLRRFSRLPHQRAFIFMPSSLALRHTLGAGWLTGKREALRYPEAKKLVFGCGRILPQEAGKMSKDVIVR